MIDVGLMTSESDIPEWGIAEVLNKPMDELASMDERKLLWERSPLSRVEEIQSPLLMMLGGKDKRVPMMNAMPLYNYMKSNNRKVKLMYFPEDSHPLGLPETEIHSVISSLVWMEEHRDKNP